MMRLWTMPIALTTALSLTGVSAWGGPGPVRWCDLTGVNPALHKAIFKNAKSAAKYGFVKGPDGNWQVMPDCHL
jgi:hypothetical protein